MNQRWRLAGWTLGLFSVLVVAAHGAASSDFEKDVVGAEPSAFACVVGVWRVGNDGKNKVLVVDGGKWKQGQPSAGLADKARALYGERYAEFLDSVKSYAYFPLAVAKDAADFENGEISFRFKGMAGRIDQGAGIVFNLKPNGDYLVLRANALENNLVLFKYVQGKRSSVEWVRDAPTETLKWHDLKAVVNGRHIQGYLDGKLLLEHDWSESISGRVGVWSKADSVVYFDDFAVKRAAIGSQMLDSVLGRRLRHAGKRGGRRHPRACVSRDRGHGRPQPHGHGKPEDLLPAFLGSRDSDWVGPRA